MMRFVGVINPKGYGFDFCDKPCVIDTYMCLLLETTDPGLVANGLNNRPELASKFIWWTKNGTTVTWDTLAKKYTKMTEAKMSNPEEEDAKLSRGTSDEFKKAAELEPIFYTVKASEEKEQCLVSGKDKKQDSDPVNQPSHYTHGKVECIDTIRDLLGDSGFIAFCRGNSIKYQYRAGLKGEEGDEAQDLAKAAWYSQMAAHVIDPEKYNDPRKKSC